MIPRAQPEGGRGVVLPETMAIPSIATRSNKDTFQTQAWNRASLSSSQTGLAAGDKLRGTRHAMPDTTVNFSFDCHTS